MNLRVLVVLLLLANLGFFAWSQWIARPAGDSPQPVAGAPRLLLASEAPQAPPLPAAQVETAGGCVSLGPFLDLTEAARTSTALRESGLLPRQRATDGPVWAGYWVALRGLVDADAAEQVIVRLRQFGVGDAYLMPAEEVGPVISLGLFTERQRALRRVDEVRALGYEPEVSERQRTGTVYWIDVDLETPGQLPDPATFEGSGRIFRLEVRPCGAEAEGSVPAAPAGVPDGVPG